MATTIHVHSNLLREPRLFDNLCRVVGSEKGAPLLGLQVARLARELVLYAARYARPGKRTVRLHVPEFCAMFGYDRAVLLRKCTPAQQDEMRRCALPERLIKPYSNFLGYTLVKMTNYNFLWNERNEDSQDVVVKNPDTAVHKHSLLQHIEAPVVRRKKGTYVDFTVSLDIVAVTENRILYQDIELEDYLALTTKAGYPWDAARTLYMRAKWKREWWDAPKTKKHPFPSRDSYADLVAAAALGNITPERNQASKLLAMLRKVGELPSVCMVPQMHHAKGKYYVTWTRYELGTVGGPPKNLVYDISPAPESWGTDPNPPSTGYQPSDEPGAPGSTAWSANPVYIVWENCLRVLRGHVGDYNYRTWFMPIVPVELAGKVLTIRVPSVAFYEHLEANFVPQLRDAIYQELGSDGRLEYEAPEPQADPEGDDDDVTEVEYATGQLVVNLATRFNAKS